MENTISITFKKIENYYSTRIVCDKELQITHKQLMDSIRNSLDKNLIEVFFEEDMRIFTIYSKEEPLRTIFL